MTANFPTSNHPERSVDAEPLTRARTGPRFLTADQQARMSESELRAESERRRALIEETRRLAR
jgi:hypothetical protein